MTEDIIVNINDIRLIPIRDGYYTVMGVNMNDMPIAIHGAFLRVLES